MTKKKVTKKKAAKKKTAKRSTNNTGQQNMNKEYDYGEPEVIRKITNKTVLGNEFLKGPKPTEARTLYTLFGIVWDYKSDESEYGTFIKFRGDFEAYNHVDEKAYAAPHAIIPTPMDSVIAGQYETAKNALADPETGELPAGKQAKFQFVIDVGYKPSDTPTGYEWTVSSRVKMQESNEMAALKRQFVGIEAPTEE